MIIRFALRYHDDLLRGPEKSFTLENPNPHLKVLVDLAMRWVNGVTGQTWTSCEIFYGEKHYRIDLKDGEVKSVKTVPEATFEILIQNFTDLTDEEQSNANDNGHGKEMAYYLRIKHNNKTIRLENDAMEPEDVRFVRDLKWVKDALIECYNLGQVDLLANQHSRLTKPKT